MSVGLKAADAQRQDPSQINAKSEEPTVEADEHRKPTLVVAELSTGSGKTASLQAMALFLKKQHPTFKIVVCLPSPFLQKTFLN